MEPLPHHVDHPAALTAAAAHLRHVEAALVAARSARDDAIRAAWQAGQPMNHIAYDTGLHRESVSRILGRPHNQRGRPPTSRHRV